jgi:ribosomal protein L37AE/L43A
MPLNRVQFQAGLSMPEFLERFGSEAQCRAALEAARWPQGFVCPACGGASRTRYRRQGHSYWQCSRRQRQSSPISGSIFEATKLPLSRWFPATQLLTQAKNYVSALELKRQRGMSYRSAWLMKHKILEAMRVAADERELDGHVEIDDAYLGGESCGGKTGRGTDDKVSFVAAVQSSPDGHPRYCQGSPNLPQPGVRQKTWTG